MLSAAGGVGRMIATQVLQSLDVNAHTQPASAFSYHHCDGDVGGTLPRYDADYGSILTAFGAPRYAPGRFLERESFVDVYDDEFRAKCAARRGAKFQK